jgi:transcriptional regulator with XRE-family HTH domain
MPRTARRGRIRLPVREIDVQIGRRIRERREALGISRDTLAAALGLSAEQLRRLEAGIATVFASRLYWLSVALVMPAGVFFDGKRAGGSPIPVRRPLGDGQSVPSAVELRRMVEAMGCIRDTAVRAAMIDLVTTVSRRQRSDGVLPN